MSDTYELDQPGDGYSLVQLAIDELERKGLIMKNGQYRPGRGGLLEPVYVATRAGAAMVREQRWLQEDV